MKLLAILTGVSFAQLVYGQEPYSIPEKEPDHYVIEDNSMLIEEAFNQNAGVIQFISGFSFSKGSFDYNYSQEIPLRDHRHQLSVSIPYLGINHAGNTVYGFGDFLISYRPLIAGSGRWARIIPRFTCIAPTGKSRQGLGTGGWGGAMNLAVTKNFGVIALHYNAGYSIVQNADSFNEGVFARRNLTSGSMGGSTIWHVKPKFNVMLEYVFTSSTGAQPNIGRDLQTVINPAIRFALDAGKTQIVPGIGTPVTFRNGIWSGIGAFLYLSVEVGH